MINFIKECSKHKKIFIYGDGEVGRLTRICLHEQGIEICAFITTNEPKRSNLMGIPVYKISTLEIDLSDTYVIICMHKMWWDDAVTRLDNYGFKNYIIVDDELRNELERQVEFRDIYSDVERNINVLLYHRVESLETSYSIIVNPINFEAQLRYICAHYNMLSCGEDWSNINKKSVAITFDDGYVDFYTKVYPLLKKYNVPATVFVSTGGIDNNKEFWWDELEKILNCDKLPEVIRTKRKDFKIKNYENKAMLVMDIRNEIIENTYDLRDSEIKNLKNQINPFLYNRDQYRTLNTQEIQTLSKDPIITIGAHTVNHILCDKEKFDVQFKEISESKKALETIIDKKVDLFAYPNGNIGLDTREILKKLDFKRAFTCEHGCIDYDEKKYDIPRCAVLNWNENMLNKRFRGMWQTSKDI